MNNKNLKLTNDRNRDVQFSDKLKYSKYRIWKNTVENCPLLNNWLTEFYYDYNKRQKLKDGIDMGMTGVEALKDDINNTFEYLSNSQKRCLGASIALIASEMGYVPEISAPVYNVINIKTASTYRRKI